MSVNPASLFRISYRMERGDFVAATRHVSARKPKIIALGIVAITAWVAFLIVVNAGSFENLPQYVSDHLAMPLLVVYLPIYILGVIVMLNTPIVSGLMANFTYPYTATAYRDMVIDLTAEGIEGGATDLYSRIGWAAVKRLVETPTHLFLQISEFYSVIIPRRAVPNEDTYRNLIGFIRARTGLSTR
jgi:hypothetical protein